MSKNGIKVGRFEGGSRDHGRADVFCGGELVGEIERIVLETHRGVWGGSETRVAQYEVTLTDAEGNVRARRVFRVSVFGTARIALGAAKRWIARMV